MEALHILVREGVPQGFQITKEKSLVLCPHNNPDDQNPLGQGIARVQNCSNKLLGAPVGEADSKAEILEQHVVLMQQLLESRHYLNDLHM